MQSNMVVIVGPTASGKSELAIKLAKKFNGEVVSVDSRQVYKGLDIGTGKVTRKEMQNVPHHLLSFVSPKTRWSVAQYQKEARKVIANILERNKLPILVGGSPLYMYVVIDQWILPNVQPNWKLRGKLEKFTTKELFSQ